MLIRWSSDAKPLSLDDLQRYLSAEAVTQNCTKRQIGTLRKLHHIACRGFE